MESSVRASYSRTSWMWMYGVDLHYLSFDGCQKDNLITKLAKFVGLEIR